MTRLLIWRHGQTEWNAAKMVQGHTDVDLDETGRAQAERAAPRLASYEPALIISSDLRRARRTAEALAVQSGLPVECDPRLRERDYGPWEGLTDAEIRDRYPDEFHRWHTTGVLSDPAIESVEDLAKRVSAALLEVARMAEGATAVVVTHGGAAAAGCASLLGWPPEIWSSLGPLTNCHFSELRLVSQRGWRLWAHNNG